MCPPHRIDRNLNNMSVFSVREQVGNEFEMRVILQKVQLGPFITSDCLRAGGGENGFIDYDACTSHLCGFLSAQIPLRKAT